MHGRFRIFYTKPCKHQRKHKHNCKKENLAGRADWVIIFFIYYGNKKRIKAPADCRKKCQQITLRIKLQRQLSIKADKGNSKN
jgi:hypothetical protein